MKVFNFGLAAIAAVLLASSVQANHLAYEGFEGVGDGTLAGTAATGQGFDGVWDITNGGGGVSTTEAAGLQYPASYPGSRVAVGGNGRVSGTAGDNAFLALDFSATTDAAVNSAPVVYMSWLAQNVAIPTSQYTGCATCPLSAGTRTTFNLAAEYPRNSGIRLNNVGGGANNALGTIGNSGNWNGGGGGAPVQSQYGDGELDPEVVDTWGAFNFNDVNNIFTGNGGTQSPPGSAAYNPAPANYDGVDHLVLRVDTTRSKYDLWVNLQADGSSDGHLSWIHTDGAVVPFVMKAFGLEAGNNSSDRAPGDMVVDEIWIADQFAFATGFRSPGAAVPEPSSIIALGGLLGLGAFVVRRRR